MHAGNGGKLTSCWLEGTARYAGLLISVFTHFFVNFLISSNPSNFLRKDKKAKKQHNKARQKVHKKKKKYEEKFICPKIRNHPKISKKQKKTQ